MTRNGNSLDIQTSREATIDHHHTQTPVNDSATSAWTDTRLTQHRLPSVPTADELNECFDAPSHVYFIYSAGLVKIGYSTEWETRVRSVRQGCAHHSELVLVMPGDQQMEAGYHDLFAAYREGGEWFRCEGKMREFLLKFASRDGVENLKFAEYHFAARSLLHPRGEAA